METTNHLRRTADSQRLFWIVAIICIGIIAGTFYSMLSYGVFFFALLAIIVLSDEEALCLLMFLMPFANIFKSSVEGQSFFTYLILLYVCWRFSKLRYLHQGFFLPFLCFAIFLVMQMAISINVLRLIKFLANIMLIYLALDVKNPNLKKLCIYYVVGIAISSSIAAIGLIPNLTDYIGVKDFAHETGRTLRFTGMYGDPNYYSVNIIISLCVILVLYYRQMLSLLPTIGLFVMMIFFVGMTASKSAFLMLLLPMLLLLYAQMKRKNYYMCAFIIICCVIFALLFFAGRIEIFNAVLYRLGEASDAAELTTGRTEIWQSYIEHFLANPLLLMLGGGFGAELVDGHGAHNTYIDIVFHLGLLGTFLLGFVFRTFIKMSKKEQKRDLFNHSVWICIGIMYFFLSEFLYFDIAFHIVIALLVLRANIDMPQAGGTNEEISL